MGHKGLNGKHKTRTLLFDIETSPNLGYIWGKYEQNVLDYVSEWYILCFAYKWLGEKKTHVVSLTDFKEYKKNPENDYRVIEKLRELFEEADIVIGHNSESFDNKKVNARFLYHNFDPPAPYQSVDTLKIARRYFKFDSNKLNDLGQKLKVGKKVETGGFQLWVGCMKGDDKSWKLMKKYNKQDVDLLEEVYLKLRPWVKNHPSLAVLESKPDACPKCGAQDMRPKAKYRATNSNLYQYFYCMSCGGSAKSRIPEPKEVVDRVRYV